MYSRPVITGNARKRPEEGRQYGVGCNYTSGEQRGVGLPENAKGTTEAAGTGNDRRTAEPDFHRGVEHQYGVNHDKLAAQPGDAAVGWPMPAGN